MAYKKNDNEEINNKNYQYIQELNKHYQNKQLIIFFGAGVSMPLGLPRWGELIEYVLDKVIEKQSARDKCKEEIQKKNFWESMEYIKSFAKVDEPKIKALIAECIKSSQDNNEEALYELDNNYKDIADSDIPFFITTNYDTFLEKIDNNCEACVIKEQMSQAFATLFSTSTKKRKIIYLHGHVNDEESIIITKEGVESIYKNEKWIEIFKNFLNNYHILFIGVSFEDEYLKNFLCQTAVNSNNDYYVITNKDVDIDCKKIIISQNYDARVGDIREIINQIKQEAQETVWIRLWLKDDSIDNFKKKIEKKLDRQEGIKYDVEVDKNKSCAIISSTHMKKSKNIQTAFLIYEKAIEAKDIKKCLSNENVIYFYSCNKENLSEMGHKQVFKKHITNLLKEQVSDNSRGYIIDRIHLKVEEGDSGLFESFRSVRCDLKPSERAEYKQSKAYSFYIDESVSIKNAKANGVEVHVSGFCFFDDRVLMEIRSEKSAIASGMIAPIGGRMRAEENFIQALCRHFADDCHLNIDNIKVCDIFTTFNANVPGVAFVCNSKGVTGRNISKPKLDSVHKLYTKNELLKLYGEKKLACEKNLLLKAFEQNKEIRKKSIKLRIVLWSNCCYSCQGCHHENLNNTGVVYDEQDICTNLKKLGELFDIRQITITGGEPMQNIKQLERMVKYIYTNFPMTNIAIITNGEKLENGVIDKLKKYNVRYKISLYGYDNDSFKAYTRYSGYRSSNYLETFKQKIKLLNDKKIRFTINIPIHKFIIDGLTNIVFDAKMQELLLEQKSKIKIIDMVKPRCNGSDTFKDLYVPLETAKNKIAEAVGLQDSDKFKELKNNIDYFEYPCKTCISCNNECFENFALTMEPNGKLLVCKNAIEGLCFREGNFEEYLKANGIEVELAEYNKDYGNGECDK